MATLLSDKLAVRRQQLSGVRQNPTTSVGTTGATPPLSVSGTTPPVAPTTATPPLSMSDSTPPMYQSPVSTTAPTENQKYGGTQVAGTNGQINVGIDGYTGGKDAFKLGAVGKAASTEDAIKKINENQVKTTAEAKSIPDPTVRSGYEIAGQATTGLVEPTAAKDPMSTYLDYLSGINTKQAETTFNATATQAELMANAGIEKDQNDLNALSAEAAQIELNKKARIAAQSNQAIPSSVYGGRVSEIERQENTRIAEINARKQVLVNQLNTKNDMIGMIMKTKEYDYQQAQETYKTQYTQAMQGIQLFRDLKKDAMQEKELADSKVASQQKAQAEAVKAEKQDARANLQIYYDNITSGALDPLNMTESQQLNIAKQEMIAGLPIGTFTNLANKFSGEDMKGQAEDYYDEKGNKFMQFVMQDKKTGKITVRSMEVAPDYREVQKMAADETALSKGTYDLGIKKNEYEMLGTENAIKKQQLANAVLTGQKSYNDIAKDTTAVASTFINPKASKYGMALATDGSVVFNLEKKDANTFKSLAGRSQCGEFVNDALGLNGGNKMVDSFEAKKALATNQTPQVGGAFVQALSGQYAKYGHTGVVTKVYPDGSFDYMDANRDGKDDGTIRSGHMTAEQAKANKIVGYTDGYKYTKNEDKPTDSQRKETEQKDIIKSTYDFFDDKGVKGKDGKVSQESYKAAKRNWLSKNVNSTAKEFDEKFKEYVNPQYYTEYGLDKSIVDGTDWEVETTLYNKNNPSYSYADTKKKAFN